MFDFKEFDALGLNLKPLRNMNSRELLLSAILTTFCVFGLATLLYGFMTEPKTFSVALVSTLLYIGGAYLLLSVLHRRRDARRSIIADKQLLVEIREQNSGSHHIQRVRS